MKSKAASIVLDEETFKIAEELANLSNKSIRELIIDLIKGKKAVSEFKITEGVKRISGIIKSDL